MGLLTAPDLHGLFGLVCGQNPDHTWAPGGLALPCCQRCLGLYAGAALAAVLHVFIRPNLTGRFLEVHGAFLLLMVPLGFHWVPQGPVLRTISGLLFGAGVTTFLWLPLAECGRPRPQQLSSLSRFSFSCAARLFPTTLRSRLYGLCLLFFAVLLPLVAAQGGPRSGLLLATASAAGLLCLSTLATANLLHPAAARLITRSRDYWHLGRPTRHAVRSTSTGRTQ
jgi:uncharacterized membrane protein